MRYMDEPLYRGITAHTTDEQLKEIVRGILARDSTQAPQFSEGTVESDCFEQRDYLKAQAPESWGRNPMWEDEGYSIQVPHRGDATAVPGKLTEWEMHDFHSTYFVECWEDEQKLFEAAQKDHRHGWVRILGLIGDRREARM